MPSIAQPGAYDFTLTVGTADVGCMLALDENGDRLWNEGTAPALTPQQRITSFGYEHTPPEVEVPVAFESWHKGGGFESTNVTTAEIVEDQDASALAAHVYNFARGVDASWANRVWISPELQTPTTSVTGQPTKFLDSSLGLFCIAGMYIYEWDLATEDWVQRDDATAESTDYTDIVEINGTLFAFRGDFVDYKYSTTGVSWSPFTGEDENGKFGVVRGQQSDSAILWKITNTGLIDNTLDGTASGWSNQDAVGHTSETVNGMIVANDDIFVTKREGIYKYTGTSTEIVWNSNYRESTNGKNPYLWVDGNFYVPYGNTLMAYDAFNTALVPVYPLNDRRTNSELTGQITAIGGNNTHLFFVVKNGAGNSYLMKGNPFTNEWHPIAYLGANDCNAMLVVGPGVIHAENPVIVLGYGNSSADYFILPRNGYTPATDPNYKFDPNGGSIYGPWVDFGALGFEKFLNRMTVIGESMSAALTGAAAYDIGNGSETTLVTAKTDGRTDGSPTTTVSFTRMRYVLTLATSGSASSPCVIGLVAYATPNPPRKKQWQPVVRIDNDITLNHGGRDRQTSQFIKSNLLASPTNRCQLTDRRGDVYIVKVNNAQGTSVRQNTKGGEVRDLEAIQLDIIEVSKVSTSGNISAIYGSDVYEGTRVYA